MDLFQSKNYLCSERRRLIRKTFSDIFSNRNVELLKFVFLWKRWKNKLQRQILKSQNVRENKECYEYPKEFKKKKIEFGLFLKKLWTKNRNSITFKPVIKKISNLPGRVFWWVLKNVKKWRKSKIKIFQTVRFGVECSKYTTRVTLGTEGSPLIRLSTALSKCFEISDT